ncbi:MAG: hypothetical protein WAJ94_02940 [Candidatus Cybelea sp.]
MSSSNGESSSPHAPLELQDILQIQTKEGTSLPFEVVGILEDPDEGHSYAVLLHEPENDPENEQFIVTDAAGNLLENEQLAQEILDDFIAYAQEDEGGESGESR